MSYKKTIWENFVTPLDEDNMNNIENGIEHVDQEVHETQTDLQETKNHLAQTDINVATNKQSIIDLDVKHDEDIKNLDNKYTKEINNTNAKVATKLPKQNIDILKDVNIEVNGDQAFITKTTVNLNEDTLEPVEQTATQIIPDATEQQSGLMTKATVKAINQMQEQIEQLQGKTTRLLYTTKTDPTAAEINDFVIAEGYTEPFDGIAVVIDKTYHIWHFYEGGVGWKDDGLDTVTTFTNDIAGIIKGSNDDGKVYANEDGTGSVKGWDVVKQDITNNTQAIAQRATLTQLATTNQNLTNLTNHVDDVEEQLQQNITNGNNALDTKITNLNNKTLQLPTTAPTKQVVATITTENVQQNLTTDSFVMTTPQTLTAAQKLQARANLDLPTTFFDGSYISLGNKPVLNTDNSTTLTTNAAEEINGIMNLHKISKTGASTDLVDSADLARQAQITTLTENVEALQTSKANASDLTSLQERVTTNEENISANTKAITNEQTTRENVDQLLQANINNKVDKVEGKGLSTNDFTNNYKTQVENNAVDISSIKDSIGTIETNITSIQSKIPSQASSINQLADKDFVNSSINNVSAYYITKNASGDAFETVAELTSATTYYSGGEPRTPTRNDYAVVRQDENNDNATTRYSYQGNQWEFQYIVNEKPLTSEQLLAINSGITAELVSELNSNTNARHTHSNKALLDTYTQTEANIKDAVDKKHTHSNKTVLDNTTASYTAAEKTKLSGIASGAEVNVQADWNVTDTTSDAYIKNKPIIPDGAKLYSTTGQNTDGAMTQKAATDEFNKKVDKVKDKGLSTNDFTNDYKSQVGSNTSARHTHSNKTVLDNITASYTTEEKEKLQGIEAEANKTTSVDGLTGGTISSAIIVNGNVNGKYLIGTRVQAIGATELSSFSKVAVLDNNGWIYSRTLSNLKTDLGVPSVSQSTGTDTAKVMSQKATTDSLNGKVDWSAIKQSTGTDENVVMSQKATTDELTTITTALSNKFTNHPQSAYNCNTCYDEGVYLIANGSNCPSGSQYGSLFVMPYRKPTGNTKPDFCVQIYLPNGDDSTKPNSMFYRTSLADSWNNWKEVAITSQIPDISGKANLSGGNAFTGTQTIDGKTALCVDSFNNSTINGYIRFTNGLQICYGSLYFSNNAHTGITFGKPFKDRNYIVSDGVKRPDDDGWDNDMIGYDKVTENGCALYSWGARTRTYIAIGRWK